MKTLDPREILQKKYDSKMSYSFWISAAIVQGEHDLAFRFLSCNADRKGIKWILYFEPFPSYNRLIYSYNNAAQRLRRDN